VLNWRDFGQAGQFACRVHILIVGRRGELAAEHGHFKAPDRAGLHLAWVTQEETGARAVEHHGVDLVHGGRVARHDGQQHGYASAHVVEDRYEEGFRERRPAFGELHDVVAHDGAVSNRQQQRDA
jgi:hypothetical protein